MTVSFEAGSWGRQGGGQRAGVRGDVVLVVVIRLGGALRVTAGEEVGARPGHSSFLFGAGPAHLLPGNHMNRSAVCVFVRAWSIFVWKNSMWALKLRIKNNFYNIQVKLDMSFRGKQKVQTTSMR